MQAYIIPSIPKMHKADISANTPWMQSSSLSNSFNTEDNKSNKVNDNSLPTMQDMLVEKNTEGKPPYSYATLIKYAIERSPENKLTLSQIYQWVIDHYPYYGSAGSGWKNSIRHNLSLNKSFVRIPRPVNEPGKGSYWTVDQYAQQNNSKLKVMSRCKKSTGGLNRNYSDPWSNNRRSFSTDVGQLRNYGYYSYPYNYEKLYGYPGYHRHSYDSAWLSSRPNSNVTYSLPSTAMNNLKYENFYDLRTQYPSNGNSLFYSHRQSCPDLSSAYPETAVVPNFGLQQQSAVLPSCDKVMYNDNQSGLLKNPQFAYDHHNSPSINETKPFVHQNDFCNSRQAALPSPALSPAHMSSPTDNNYSNTSPSTPLIMTNHNSPIDGSLSSPIPYYSPVAYLGMVSADQSNESLGSSCSSSSSLTVNGLCQTFGDSPKLSQVIPGTHRNKSQQESNMASTGCRFDY